MPDPALRTGFCLYFCAVLGLTAARFGSTPDRFLHQTFLLLLPVAVVALWRQARIADARFVVLALVGLVLLTNSGLRPATEAQGYVLASVGWAGLAGSLWLASGTRCRRRLILFLILLGVLEASLGLVQAVGGVDRIGSYERGLGTLATGTLINRNHFAGLINMVIGLALGALYASFASSRPGRRSETYAKSWIVIMACAVLGLALALSLSRAGILILIFTLAFVGGLLWLRQRSDRRGLPAWAAVLLLVLTLGLIAGFGAEALVGRFSEIAEDERPQAYLDTLKLIADHPLAGVGPGMYRWHFRPYQTSLVDRIYSHAHNDYLQAAAEWGIPVALALWGFVAWRFAGMMRLFLEAREPTRAGVGLGCAAATFSILVHSLVDFNLYIPANLLFFTTVLGIAWAAEEVGETEAPPAVERPSLHAVPRGGGA